MEAVLVSALTGDKRQEHSEFFEQLFRLRHKIFVQQRRWTLPTRLGNLDIDQYDCPQAVYFTDMNDEGVVEGHVRLTPTLTHSLMADYFPHLLDNDRPRGEHIYEATRYIVAPRHKSREANRAAKARLLGAMLEWAIANSVEYIQTVIDTATYASFVEITPETILLGKSYDYGGGNCAVGGGQCVGIRWPVTDKVLRDIRMYGDPTSCCTEACRNRNDGACSKAAA